MITTYALNIAPSLAFALANSSLGESAADQAKRLQFDGVRTDDFHLLLLMTALVAIGVIMEGPEIVHEARNAWLQCRHRRVLRRSVAPWITLVGALGWLLVAVGVAGEGYWEVQVSHDDEAITSFDEGKLGDAEIAAGAANERASKLEAANITLQGQLAKTLAEADSSERDAVGAKKEAGSAEKDLQASLERTQRLEAQLSWRTVTPEQARKISDFLIPWRLRALSPLENVKITFTYLATDQEAFEYAEELKAALDSALEGLNPQIQEPTSMMALGQGRPPEGLFLEVADGNNQAAILLQRALKDAGIDAPGEINGTGDTIRFFVAMKPQPVDAHK